ncbi:MAG: hypothetical protein EPN22_07275 [Nitrospirae bacterium]|nr:MAG: hypothetical protein EPN22_07275 [Nitrospirota bacterium]
MPTRSELKSLYDRSESGNADPVLGVGNKWVWTSELDGSSSAWLFHFHNGAEFSPSRGFSSGDRDGSYNVRHVVAVRSRR